MPIFVAFKLLDGVHKGLFATLLELLDRAEDAAVEKLAQVRCATMSTDDFIQEKDLLFCLDTARR